VKNDPEMQYLSLLVTLSISPKKETHPTGGSPQRNFLELAAAGAVKIY
jgi:hypothetical protein